jgi:hypothetical protein
MENIEYSIEELMIVNNFLCKSLQYKGLPTTQENKHKLLKSQVTILKIAELQEMFDLFNFVLMAWDAK